MQKRIPRIKSFLARLLGAYLCCFAPPLAIDLMLFLPRHVDSGDWGRELLYMITPWCWMDMILGGRSLFTEALTARVSDRFILILIVYGLLGCFLAALALWFKKPWRWWSAATLITASTLMHWLHMWAFGLGFQPLLIVCPLIYVLCFLGARLLRMEQLAPAPTIPK